MGKNKEIHRSKIGGQALIEGVMMRGIDKEAMAVRQKDGEIYVEVKSVPANKWYQKALFIRGVFNFILQMKNGYKYLMKSMDVSGMLDEEEETKDKKTDKAKDDNPEEAQDDNPEEVQDEKPVEVQGDSSEEAQDDNSAEKTEKVKSKSDEFWEAFVGVVGLVGGLVIAVVLFMFVPAQGFSLFSKLPTFADTDIDRFQALFEGIIRIILFVAYMWAVSFMKEIRVTYEYHGAEHKTIATYEAREELTPENVKKHKRFHPRCGTSFIFLVLAISILFYSILQFFLPISSRDVSEWLGVSVIIANIIRTGVKLLCLPILVGITYEVVKLAGRYDKNIVMRIISAPGLGLQRLTTREPSEKQIEVAIAAMNPVIPENRELDKW